MSGEDEEITLNNAISAGLFEPITSIARISNINSNLECGIDMGDHIYRYILHAIDEQSFQHETINKLDFSQTKSNNTIIKL